MKHIVSLSGGIGSYITLKRVIAKFEKEDECILYMGIDWSEQHRCEAITKNYKPYKVEYPLCQEIKFKQEYLEELKEDGFKIPRLYQIGLTHNNCGGRCVKAGIGHWILLLEKDRNRFLEAENEELLLQQKVGKPYTHLKRKGQPYSLHQLRMDKERQVSIFDFEEINDFGACSCFSEEE